jgi:TonB family protein
MGVTATTGVAFDLEGIRRREVRRALVVSACAHVALLVALVVIPETRSLVPPRVIAVDLVAAPSRGPSKAAPPAARPIPRAPVKKKVVLPQEPTLPPPRPREVVPEAPPEPVEVEYEDVLARLRAERGETAPEAAPAAPEAAAGEVQGSGPATVSPEVAAWVRRAKIHVRESWVLPPGFRTQALHTHVRVDLDADGNLRSDPEITQRSGNPYYDDGVVRAIRKASPLPAPPEAGPWTFVFIPEDSY